VRPTRLSRALGLGAVMLSSPATAADLSVPMTTPEPPPLAVEGPTFSFTAYLWAAGLTGRSSTLPPLPATDIDITFLDALKDFDGGIMGTGEIDYGRWSFLTDIMVTQVGPGGTLPGGADVDLRSRSLTIQQDVLYRVYADAGVSLDLGVGARYWHLDNRLEIGPTALIPGGVDFDVEQDWIDPLIAGRAIIEITGPWSVSVLGDIGGFDVGSKLTYQVAGFVNYRWSDRWTFHAGYRLLSVDYENDDFLYDVRQYGPMLAATYRF
jgi:hypothetical protein